jgi:WD40 repeat protein
VEQLHRKWSDRVTSIGLHRTNMLGAAGTVNGRLEVMDLEKGQTLRSIMKGSKRIGCLAWDADCLIAGGKDTNICGYDLRKK